MTSKSFAESQSAASDPKLVLIIDDSEDEILLTQRILSRISPEIRTASALSGEEGLAWLNCCPTLPALTLLDLKMTGITGIETLHRIRADERLKNLPVAVVTTSDIDAEHDAARNAGANAVLHKSIDMDRFTRRVRKELRKWMYL